MGSTGVHIGDHLWFGIINFAVQLGHDHFQTGDHLRCWTVLTNFHSCFCNSIEIRPKHAQDTPGICFLFLEYKLISEYWVQAQNCMRAVCICWTFYPVSLAKWQKFASFKQIKLTQRVSSPFSPYKYVKRLLLSTGDASPKSTGGKVVSSRRERF